MGLFNFFSSEVAIDLGTANTLIWVKGKGIVLNEPSIVAYSKDTKQIIAIGDEAQAMVGKTHRDITVTRPIRDGVIADFEITEGMLRAFIRKVATSWQPAQRIIVSVPSGITPVEKRAVRDSCEQAGAKEVHLIPEPMSAAIGIGIDVNDSLGNLIVDIGGGTTEIAVIALSGIVVDESIKTAGDAMNNAVAMWFRRQHNILIGDRTAELIKCSVGSAMPLEEELEIEVKGRDLLGGVPRMIRVSSADIRQALSESVNTIVEAILKLLERTPPELSADIFDRGIMLSGGGALLKGLDKKIMEVTNLPVHIPDNPLEAVARGTGKVLDNFNEYKKVLLKSSRF